MEGVGNEYSTYKNAELPLWRIIALTFGMIGNQLIWALQNGNASSYFLSLGLPDYLVGFAWLPGPLGGIIVQPIIGSISDRHTGKWGKRRPFLILTVIIVILFGIVYSNAELIAKYNDYSEKSKRVSLCVAILSLWVLDWAINGTQTVLRALYVDIAPPSQQTVGMAWFSWMNSLGNIIGFGLGGCDYTQLGFVSNVQALYLIGSVVLFFTILVTMITSKEVPLKKGEIHVTKQTCFEKTGLTHLVKLLKTLPNFPKEIRLVWFTQNIAFFAWYFIMLYGTVWMAVSIYGGDPDAPDGSVDKDNYDEGVRIGNLALMMQAIGSMIYSWLLPFILKFTGPRVAYGFAQVIQAVFMILVYWATESWQAITILVVLSIPWSTAWTVPWALASTALTHSPDKALFLAAFFLAQVFPEIATVVIANVVLYFNDNVSLVIALGGVVALFSIFFVPFFPIKKIYAMVDEPGSSNINADAADINGESTKAKPTSDIEGNPENTEDVVKVDLPITKEDIITTVKTHS